MAPIDKKVNSLLKKICSIFLLGLFFYPCKTNTVVFIL